MPNINYWSNKQTRAEQATLHTLLMEKILKMLSKSLSQRVRFIVQIRHLLKTLAVGVK